MFEVQHFFYFTVKRDPGSNPLCAYIYNDELPFIIPVNYNSKKYTQMVQLHLGHASFG